VTNRQFVAAMQLCTTFFNLLMLRLLTRAYRSIEGSADQRADQ
jgi:hypothetical protein